MKPHSQYIVEPEAVKEHRKKLEQYRRKRRLEPILKVLHQISQGKSETVLTCGIGIIRKDMEGRGRNLNCPVLEVDLLCHRDRLDYEFQPDSLDFASKIRLCPSLGRLEESPHQEDQEALEKKVSDEFDKWTRRMRKQNKGPINPFDSSTYKSFLNKIGRILHSTFRKVTARDAYENDPRNGERWDDFKEFLLHDESATKNLEIYDTWIIFQREKQDASKIVSQDVQRFLRTLRDLPGEQDTPKFWTRICTEDGDSSMPGGSSQDVADFLLPLKQNKSQLEILRSLEHHDCVVVQGPPGTGKSHTIGEHEFDAPVRDCNVCVGENY